MVKSNEPITILIPTYNRRPMLMQTIACMMKQTYEHFSFLIYDDGSTDDTKEAIHALVGVGYPISYVQNNINNGVAHARNRLLDLCTTKIAAWQDSDDFSHPRRLEIQLSHMHDYEMVYTAFSRMGLGYVTENSQPIQADNFANASGMFHVDRSIRFNTDLMIAEDNDWRPRMENIYTSIYLKDVLYTVRFHKDRLGVKYRGTRKRNLKEEAKSE